MSNPQARRDLTWRKSARSNHSGDCVELAVIDATNAPNPATS